MENKLRNDHLLRFASYLQDDIEDKLEKLSILPIQQYRDQYRLLLKEFSHMDSERAVIGLIEFLYTLEALSESEDEAKDLYDWCNTLEALSKDENISEDEAKDLYDWCIEQAVARYRDKLSPEKFEKLESVGFPWAYYENELDKFGFHWKKNNPKGVRYSQEG